MIFILIAAYLWVALWTGAIASRLYRHSEPNRLGGSVSWGLMWPISLPLLAFAMRSPPWTLPDEKGVCVTTSHDKPVSVTTSELGM